MGFSSLKERLQLANGWTLNPHSKNQCSVFFQIRDNYTNIIGNINCHYPIEHNNIRFELFLPSRFAYEEKKEEMNTILNEVIEKLGLKGIYYQAHIYINDDLKGYSLINDTRALT